MSDFRTRLNEEYTQLGDRLGKLNTFLQSDMLAGLPAAQQDLLKKQSVHMTDYYNVLKERLELLDKEAGHSSTFGNDKANPSVGQHDASLSNTPYGPEGKHAGQSGESEDGGQAIKE
jgi:hypothetical protein